MIFSLDGESFTKFSGNPVIPKPEEWKDFRDPKVRAELIDFIHQAARKDRRFAPVVKDFDAPYS